MPPYPWLNRDSNMERVRGRIAFRGRVILNDLDITVKVVEPSGQLPRWCGGFLLTDATAHIELDGPYRLELEDGRSGDINVTNVDYSVESRARRVLFTAAGSLS